ncbi:MAG: hypothetical protein Q9162_000075 [Coniocarpon cinnabarinum]
MANVGFDTSPDSFQHKQPSMSSLRDRPGASMPSINTSRAGQHPLGIHDLQTPGTGFDMNNTPLLPSQLLMGSPFNPGPSSTFQSPQFQNFNTFPSQNGQQSNQQNNVGSPLGQTPMSPTVFQNMLSPTAMNNGQGYSQGLPSPTNATAFATNYGGNMGISPGLMSGTSRTVYLGNIPQDTSAEEILSHVRSGQIESVRLLPDKNCAFISFLHADSAVHFHSDAILKKLNIKGSDIKIGWGKPSQVPSSVALAAQQSGASRNVYLGNLPPEITEEEIKDQLVKFGPIDTIKLVREKNIGFVHFLSISNAMKAVQQLPQEPNWQHPRRVFYGKDRCAYVSKTQQQNAAQCLGIAPSYAQFLNTADKEVLSHSIAQQSMQAASISTAAGGMDNIGNRTVYLGNIHPETTTEEICNVVRGGLLHHIRYIPDKHICFVTFIDPTAAANFFALSSHQGLMIHNRRLKLGWGKHSGPLPNAIALAVGGGASRNVYIGNIDEGWSEERLRQDFSEYGEIELVNTLREKSCAFVNFTNIANAIKAIEAIRNRDEYKRFKINFGKDRCGNAPRQNHHNHQNNVQFHDNLGSPVSASGMNAHLQNGFGHQGFPNHFEGLQSVSPSNAGSTNGYMNGNFSQHLHSAPLTTHARHASALGGSSGLPGLSPTLEVPSAQQSRGVGHGPSSSFSVTPGTGNGSGFLNPEALKSQHARTVSLPAFSQPPIGSGPQIAMNQGSMGGLGAGLGSLSGLAISERRGLNGWSEDVAEN